MSSDLEVLVNAINVAASIAIIGVLVVLASTVRTSGREVIVARFFLKEREASRAMGVLLVSLLTFLASNVLELYGDVIRIDWTVNEIVETVALFIMLGALIWFVRILRVPRRRANPVHVIPGGGESR